MNRNANEINLALAAAGKRAEEHEWKPGADVQSVWKKFGWTPPSRSRIDYSKRNPEAPTLLRIVRG